MKKMISKTLCFGVVAGMAMAVAGCSDDSGTKSNPREDIPVSRSEEELVEADNEFAYKLLAWVNKTESEKELGTGSDNIVFSPLSLSIAMCMTANGAAGDTREEILNVLGFDEDDMEEANAFNRKLLERLPSLDKKTKISLANSMWIHGDDKSYLREDFALSVMDNYKAPVSVVSDLSSREAMEQINAWGKDHTNGLIPQFLSKPLDDGSALALLNALYFKGEWTEKFDKSLTAEKVFHNSDGTARRVPTMYSKEGEYQCFSDDTYSAVSFPYGNGAYSMIIVLPDEGVNLPDCIRDLNAKDITALARGEMYEKGLEVQLPKFEIQYDIEYDGILQSMGIRKAFDKYLADFSAMWTGKSTYITRVAQSATITVDEDGAEAAAVTIVVNGDMLSPGPMMTSKFFVDRPFVFIIAEHSTGLPLFMGRVTKL